MSIHLVGGGHAVEHRRRVYGEFAVEAMQRAHRAGRAAARVGVIQLHEGDSEQGSELFTQFADILSGLGPLEPVPFLVPEGAQLASGRLVGLDALLVAGGLTPAYLTAVGPVRDEIRALVANGAPYLGFSAGAAIAARRAIVGGWKVGDLTVCHEDNAEELDELTVADGLGLVDFSVDVHAAQWGNLGRAMMAVAAGAVQRVVAVDESTVLIVPQGSGEATTEAGTRVKGAGQAWWVEPGDAGVRVAMQREPPAA